MRTILVLLVSTVVLFVNMSTAYSQGKKPVKPTSIVKGKVVAKSRGDANPNIITDISMNDTPAARPAKTRGAASCDIYFDNYTGYSIYVYVDGHYKGTVAPWDDISVSVGNGFTTIFCISAGRTREWRDSGSCANNDVYFKLE